MTTEHAFTKEHLCKREIVQQMVKLHQGGFAEVTMLSASGRIKSSFFNTKKDIT